MEPSGLVTGVGPGTVEISATSSGVTGRADLFVAARVPSVVAVAPDSVALSALDDTVRLIAEVRDQIGRVMPGVAVAWSSSDPMVAVVDSAGLVTARANGTAAIEAKAGTLVATAEVTVVQRISTVLVAPAAHTLLPGATLQFTAEATDANGHPVAGTEFSWASSDPAVATVDASGLATALGPGDAEISAISSGESGRANLRVAERVPSVVLVSPDSVALVALTETVRLYARVRDQTGHAMSGVAVAWSSADPAVAMVDSAGLVTARANGTAIIKAKADTATGTAEVTVAQRVSTVRVSPPADTLQRGETQQFTAEATDANGHPVAGTVFSWASSKPSVATVDASGLATGVTQGSTDISATAGSTRGAAKLTVAQRVSAVSVLPAADTLMRDAVLLLRAKATDANGDSIPGTDFEWSSTDESVVVVDSLGMVSAFAEGAATITATAGGMEGPCWSNCTARWTAPTGSPTTIGSATHCSGIGWESLSTRTAGSSRCIFR